MARKAAASGRQGRKTAAHSRKRRSTASARSRTGRRWSRQVTEHSDALTLDQGVFSSRGPKRIAPR